MKSASLPRHTHGWSRLLAIILLLLAAVAYAPRGAAAAPQAIDLQFNGTDDPSVLQSFLNTTLPGTNSPPNATVGAGALNITTTQGDLPPFGSGQDNALAYRYTGSNSGSYMVGARLLKPGFTGPYQSAGIFIGLSTSQYIRFTAGKGTNNSAGDRLQLDVVDTNGKVRTTTVDLPNETLDHITKSIDLFLNIEYGGSGKITALYRIDSDDSTAGRLMTSRNFPRWLRQANGKQVFAGVISTKRGTTTPLNVAFDWFRLTLQPQITALVTGVKTVDKDGVSPGQLVNPGDTLTYTITVTNNGIATSATIQDPIPLDTVFKGGLTTNPGTLPAATFDGTRVIWSGNLGAGQSLTITFQVTVNQPPLQSATIVNTAYLTSGPGALPSLLSTSTLVGGTPDLSDSTYTAAPSLVGPNGSVTYTVSLLNDGTATASSVSAQLLVPEGTTLVANSATASTGTPTIDPSQKKITWTASNPIAANAPVVTISFAAKVGTTLANGSPLISYAILQANDTVPTILTAQATYSVASAVSATKTVDKAEADPGALLRYTISVANNSGTQLNNLQVIDPIPQDTSYQGGISTSPGAPVPTYDAGTNRVVWTIPTLTASQAITMSFQVQIHGNTLPFHSAIIANKAVLTSSSPSVPQTLLSAATVVRGVADLSDSIYSVSPATVGPLGTLTYDLNLLNDGTTAATNGTAELTIPAGTTLVAGSATWSRGSLTVNATLNKISWAAGGPLPIGAVVHITFKTKLNGSTAFSTYGSTATLRADGIVPYVRTATATFSQSAPGRTLIYLPFILR